MATLDEIRLQQLLAPFQNQNIGITNTTAAAPFINTADILNQYNVPGLQNQNLVDQIIKQNLKKIVPVSYPDVSAAPLRFATDDQASFFFPSNTYTVPLKKPTRGIVDSTIASNLLYEDLPSGIDTSYGVANEPDVIEEKEKSKGGLAELLRTIIGFAVPGANLFRGDRSLLQGIRSLNQRLRSTDFGRAKTLMDYLDMKKYGGYEAREKARQATMAQARGIQKRIDRGEFDGPSRPDRDRGSVTTQSAAKTSKVGGGGYTKSDSARESRRGGQYGF